MASIESLKYAIAFLVVFLVIYLVYTFKPDWLGFKKETTVQQNAASLLEEDEPEKEPQPFSDEHFSDENVDFSQRSEFDFPSGKNESLHTTRPEMDMVSDRGNYVPSRLAGEVDGHLKLLRGAARIPEFDPLEMDQPIARPQ